MSEYVELELTSVAHGGEAMGRHAGQFIFVPYGAPGDRVRVEIVERGKNWARARLIDILQPSPDRVEPPCPYYGECAGCQLQHLAYSAQLAAKREIVRDQLTRLGRLPDVHVRPVIGMADPWRYRNCISLYPTPEGGLGIRDVGSRQVVPIETCLLFHPLIEDLFAALDLEMTGLQQITLRAGTRTGDQMLIFETQEDQAPELEVELPISCVLKQRDGDVNVLMGDEWLEEILAGRRFRISAPSPFPINTELAEQMISVVHDWLDPHGDELLLHAGSGVGWLGLSLRHAVSGLIAVEENPWAVHDFMINAGDTPRVGIIEGPLAASLADIEEPLDLAIVTPSESGLDREGVAELKRLAPSRLIYEAHDVAILARDAIWLSQAGYMLTEVQPVDMLPQTSRVHILARWEKVTHSSSTPALNETKP